MTNEQQMALERSAAALGHIASGHSESNGNGEGEDPVSTVDFAIRTVADEFGKHLVTRREARSEIAARHRQEIAEVEARQRQELAGLDEDIKKLSAAIDGLNGKASPVLKNVAKQNRKSQPQRVGRSTESGTATGHGISLEVALQAAIVIRRMMAEKPKGAAKSFTQKDFYRHPDLDWDQTKGSHCVRYLREIGFLRKAGMAGRRELWAIMDNHAIEREVELAKERARAFESGAVAIDGDEPPRDRIVAVLENEGDVHGLSDLCRLTGIPSGSLSSITTALEREGVIRIERPAKRGRGKYRFTLGGTHA